MSRLLLLPLLFSFGLLGAQNLSVSAAIALANGNCSFPVTDPDTDCPNVPESSESLIYLPGEGDILITYRITNNSPGTVVMALITDSDRGTILPFSSVNIPPGNTYVTNRIFPAETEPRAVTPTVTATVESSTGNSITVTNEYDFEVAGPEAEIFAYPILASAICTDTTDLATCGIAPANTPTTLTTPPGEPIYLEYQLLNTGIVTIDEQLWEDPRYGTLTSVANSTPGSDLRFRKLVPAPTVPGTYNLTVEYTGTDDFGNTLDLSTSYTLIVEGAQAEIFAYPILASAICTDTTDLATCGIAPANTPTTLTTPPGEPIYLEYQLLNTGIVTIDEQLWEDPRYGTLTSAANSTPGSDLRFRKLVPAPTVPGTYNLTVEYTGTDDFGNTLDLSTSYTLIVEGAQAEIFAYPILASAICTDTTDLATCGIAPANTPTTLTTPPGEPIYLEYQLLNTGIVTIDEQLWEDPRYGTLTSVANSTPGSDLRFRKLVPAPTVPGTYNLTVEYTGTDDFGNTLDLSTSYTLIVEGAQAEIFAYPILASAICTDTTDLATCGIAPANTPTTLTTPPGEPIYLEYQLLNTGIVTIDEQLWEDPRYGTLTSAANSTPGSDLRFRKLVPAPTVPGTYNLTVEYTGTDDFGNTLDLSTSYTLIVEGAQAEIFAYPILASAICTDTTDLATCGIAPANTPTTLTTPPGEPIYLEYRLLNTGIVTIDEQLWEDPRYGTLTSAANSTPGSDLRFRKLVPAPTVPGTYNLTVEYTGTDDFGNTLDLSASYTLIVEGAQAEIFAYPILASAICTDTTDLATCGIAPANTPTTLTTPPGEPIYLEYRLLNTGIVTIDEQLWEDPRYGTLTSAANSTPGSDLRFRKLVPAPTVPGTYNLTVEYTGTDDFGNTLDLSTSYTLIVDCALGDDVPPEAICQNISIEVEEGQTTTIIPSQINDGSGDNCGALSGASLDITTFSCADVGDNIVTLTVTDDSGNTADCQATVAVTALENVSAGPVGSCTTITADLLTADDFVAIVGPQGRLIASVRKNVNPGVRSIRLELYREAALTQGNGDGTRLSKRFTLTPLNAAGDPVNPLTPITIRLFFRDAELTALENNSGFSRADFALVKDNSECGPGGFTGENQVILNTAYNRMGCNNLNQYYQVGVLRFSTFYLLGNAAALPVEWQHFSVSQKGNTAILDWSTASESKSSHFVIERSADGRGFSSIGQTAAAGESQESTEYRFVDGSPHAGINYYRLRQVDFDGSENLSEVRSLDFSGSAPAVVIYPNPASDRIYLQGAPAGRVELYGITGRLLRRWAYLPGQALEIGELAAGIYQLRIGREAIRLVKR